MSGATTNDVKDDDDTECMHENNTRLLRRRGNYDEAVQNDVELA